MEAENENVMTEDINNENVTEETTPDRMEEVPEEDAGGWMEENLQNREMENHYRLGHSVKLNKILLVLISLVTILPFEIRDFSPVGLGLSLVIYIILFVYVFRSSPQLSAAAFVPVVVLADALCYIAVYYEVLKETVHFKWSVFFADATIWFALILGLGICACIFTKKMWTIGVGWELIGAAFLLKTWSNQEFLNIKEFKFIGYGQFLFVLYLAASVYWLFLLRFSDTAAQTFRKRNLRITAVLVLFVIILSTAGKDFAVGMAGVWEASVSGISGTAFAWWKVILASIVMIVLICAQYFQDKDYEYIGVDSFFLILTVNLLVGIRLCLTAGTVWGWAALVVLGAETLECAHNSLIGRKTFRCTDRVYLPIQFAVFCLTLILFYFGMWINFIFSAVFLYFFYQTADRFAGRQQGKAVWRFMVLLCICSEAAAWIFRFHNSVESFAIIVEILLVATVAMLILNLRHPEGRVAGKGYNVAIYICTGILCFLTMVKA